MEKEKKPFCEYCNSLGVRHKKDCPTLKSEEDLSGVLKVFSGKEEAQQEGVSVKEFNDFKKEVRDNTDRILDALSQAQGTPHIEKIKETGEEINEFSEEVLQKYGTLIPMEYNEIFDKYFDLADGFRARWSVPKKDESGCIMFTILVPSKFSNMTPAHKDMYKEDVRSKPVQALNVSQGIDDWCKKVAININYDKKFRFKS